MYLWAVRFRPRRYAASILDISQLYESTKILKIMWTKLILSLPPFLWIVCGSLSPQILSVGHLTVEKQLLLFKDNSHYIVLQWVWISLSLSGFCVALAHTLSTYQ